jgi:peptidoglycan hydrolase-like protein with peptidoglycan-binding domain
MLMALQSIATCGGRVRTVLVGASIILLTACSHPLETPVAPVKHPSETTVAPVKPSTSTVVPKRPSDPEVRAAQEALARLGYYRGPIDGITGPKTRAAVAKYQTDLGLPPDGKVSRDLVAQVARARTTPEHDTQVDPTLGPIYEVGDAYIYTDGQVETVVSANDDRVEWKNDVGSRWSSARDFTLPSNQTDNGEIAEHRPLTWPLKVGATGTYVVVATGVNAADPARKTAELWQCIVEGREQTSVVAGIFDTYKIVCRLDTGTPGTTQSRSWYYAPAVGHYVRYVDNAAAPLNDLTRSRSRDLTAISPSVSGWPSEARIGLEWAVSHALEVEPDGQPIPWESSAIAARFVIEPGRRLDLEHSGQCRRFTQARTAADGARRLYPGVACRSAGGRWRPVGLDGTPNLVTHSKLLGGAL